MPVIKPTCVRDLKLRVNLADVVSRVVSLRKAGGTRLKGLCPFHNEKTPSFNVDADKGFYKCFGCGKAGDAITFVRETEQLSFTEAVEALGQRYGVAIEYEAGSGPSREERSLRQELFDLHDQAAAHFHESFKAAGPAGDFMRAYWVDERRFSPELAEEFRIGAAAPDGGGLGAAILRRKYSEEAIRQCGLFFIRDDAMITAGRAAAPLQGPAHDPHPGPPGPRRRVHGEADRAHARGRPGPRGEVRQLARRRRSSRRATSCSTWTAPARPSARAGPSSWSRASSTPSGAGRSGLKTAVAPQGTSITDGQIALLRRYHFEVECFFDSDEAGQKAALRMLPMALKAGLEVRFLTLDGDAKVDPDLLFLERGIAAYEEVRKGVALGDGVRVPGLAPLARHGVVRAEVPRRAGRPRDHRRRGERGLARRLRVRGRGAPAAARRRRSRAT